MRSTYNRRVSSSVSPVSTSVAVADYIRDRIHADDYGPGDKLPPQRELAESLGVSRVSVREGLKTLTDDGYIEVRRGASGGAFVTELSQPIDTWRKRLRNQMGELDDLVDYRIAVESHVAYLAAMRSTRSDLTEMRAAIRAMRGITNTEEHSRRAYRLADGRFHDALGRAGRNEKLNRSVVEARNEMFVPYATLRFDEPIEAVQTDHQSIYEAVRDGESESAARLMAEHIRRTRAQLRSFVKDGRNPSSDVSDGV